MPIYKESIELSDGEETMKLYVFDYSNKIISKENQPPKKLISVDSCMTLGTRNFTILNEEQHKRALKEGHVYTGYYIKTINGPYDYCYKIWTNRRLPIAPLNVEEPGENESVKALAIDRNEGYLGLACGPHLAYCPIEAFQNLGIQVDKFELPFSGLRVKLRRETTNRPKEIPYAAYEAIPATPLDKTEI